MAIPPRLAEVIDALDMADDRSARIQMIVDIARRYREVPPSVASRPWDEDHRVGTASPTRTSGPCRAATGRSTSTSPSTIRRASRRAPWS
ncbi:MAG: hypothetical protein U0470_10735 [Anaerolineae bacterium]